MHEVMATYVAAVRALPETRFAATSSVKPCFERVSCPVPLPGRRPVRAGIASVKPREAVTRSCSVLQCH